MAISSRFTRGLNPLISMSRHLTSKADYLSCRCSQRVPDRPKMIQLFNERKLSELSPFFECPLITSHQHEYDVCVLSEEMQKVSDFVTGTFNNVMHHNPDLGIDLGVFRTINDDMNSELDFRRVTQEFLNRFKEKGLLGNLGSIVDLGGVYFPLIDSLSSELSEQPLPALVVSKNPLLPALQQFSPQVNFALDDPSEFLTSKKYQEFVSSVENQGVSLFLCNRDFRHLTAEKGWSYLEAIWSKLRPGDYLFLSGIDAHAFECFGMQRKGEVGGIVEFHSGGKFFTSAFSKDFINHFGKRLGRVPIAIRESSEATWTIREDTHFAFQETHITSFNSFFLLRK